MLTSVTIPTTDEKFYKQYLVILNPLLDRNSLRMKEIELLAEFYREYDSYDNMSDEQKDTLLFHKNTVRKIIMKLDLSRANYDNLVHALRKKNFIRISQETGISVLNKTFIVSKAANQTLTLKFKINDNNQL